MADPEDHGTTMHRRERDALVLRHPVADLGGACSPDVEEGLRFARAHVHPEPVRRHDIMHELDPAPEAL
eukprot:152143-Lingulodinium_polyedra.AAC.1